MYIVTFYTHYGAQAFARNLAKKSIRAVLMPVPRALSSSCGTCVRLEAEWSEEYRDTEDIEGAYEIIAGSRRGDAQAYTKLYEA